MKRDHAAESHTSHTIPIIDAGRFELRRDVCIEQHSSMVRNLPQTGIEAAKVRLLDCSPHNV